MFWQYKDFLAGEHSDGGIEALQTDIQRFMAILGFCLMAIFALVQAIPVTEPNSNNVIEDLSRKIEFQNAELERLKAENERLKKETIRLAGYPALNKSLRSELDLAIKDVKRQGQEIESIKREKIEKIEDLIAYKGELDRRDREIRRLKGEKDFVERMLDKVRQALKAPKIKKEKPRVEPKKSVKKKGLYVAFESDRVFLDLLESGKIILFISIADANQGFQVLKRGSTFEFPGGSPPSGFDLWEVNEAMVPHSILDAFRDWTTLASRKKILVVGLTPRISGEIRGRKVTSGKFIIGKGGRVAFSSSGE